MALLKPRTDGAVHASRNHRRPKEEPISPKIESESDCPWPSDEQDSPPTTPSTRQPSARQDEVIISVMRVEEAHSLVHEASQSGHPHRLMILDHYGGRCVVGRSDGEELSSAVLNQVHVSIRRTGTWSTFLNRYTANVTMKYALLAFGMLATVMLIMRWTPIASRKWSTCSCRYV